MTQRTQTTSAYPEHDKLRAVSHQSQTIGEFLDTSGFVLAEWREVEGYLKPQLVPVGRGIHQVLAEYFDIDLTAIENEKRAMLNSIQETNS